MQAVFEECEDYFVLTTGGSATPAAAHSLYIQLPEGKSYEDKHILGICNAETGRLVDVIDVILGYPKPDIITLGLFLIAPEYSSSISKKTYNVLEQWVRDQGCAIIQVSVYEESGNDTSFWNSLDFGATGQISQNGNHTVVICQKCLL